MNENIHSKQLIKPFSCAYLYNYVAHDANTDPLKAEKFAELIADTPLYLKSDEEKLRQFLRHHVGRGRGMETLYLIESGKIRPSRMLIDHVNDLVKGNNEFILLDEQKEAFEEIIHFAKKRDRRRTIIVRGGPGTGKSVVAIQSLARLLKHELNVHFVAPNASFRTVLMEMLIKKKGDRYLQNIFRGSSSFYDVSPETFDVLIIDEAHRLKSKGAWQYRGENQVEDIVNASRVNVFFVDDQQQIRPTDIGSTEEIKKVAKRHGSTVSEIELLTQFRCSGAVGFINWIDHTLQIRETGNYDGWDQSDFDFRLFDSPHEVYSAIKEKMLEGHKARLLAGYAWHWTPEKSGNKNGEVEDVKIEEHDFSMPWNGRAISMKWAIHPDGIDQIGCVHTSQGLEFDYVGVLIGNDLKFDPDTKTLFSENSDYKDTTGKKGLRNDPAKLNRYIKNIYKVLMSRGMKGAYVFIRDKNLAEHFRQRLQIANAKVVVSKPAEKVYDFVAATKLRPEQKYSEYLPVYSLQAAAGYFGHGEEVAESGWVKADIGRKLDRLMFVAKVVGRSMEPMISDGSWCVFRANPGGSRQGKIVLVQHHDINDPETGGKYTIKKYQSKKKFDEQGGWEHEEIVLQPLNKDYKPVVIQNADDGGFQVIAEFVAFL